MSPASSVTRHFDQVVDVRVLLTVDNMKEKTLANALSAMST
jgi:hypothetical protein